MAADLQVITDPLVDLMVTSTISSFGSERRFQRDLTIGALKGKLELLTGASSKNMVLQVYNKDDRLVCEPQNDEALLGSYHIDSGMRLHVIDKAGQMGEFEDVSKVEKFELTADQYDSKRDTVRNFKKNMKLGQFREVDPEEKKRLEEEKNMKEKAESDLAAAMKIGDRCEVHVKGQPDKRGALMYVGEVDFKPGEWIGVQYDEPLGKHDGSVQGKSYFKCPPKYGGFVRPSQVSVGDFPELGFDDDDMEM